jgi:OFA family oxalate/formate antiporter-like MFS transporter
MRMQRVGPRRLAISGGMLFGAGYLVSAWALQHGSLVGLYLGYGVMGGTGLGLGYVTPVATVARWFPDRKGLVTGLVVMGFGLGAWLMAKVAAPWLMAALDGNLVKVFLVLGLVFGPVSAALGAGLRWPPAPPCSIGAASAPAPLPVRASLVSGRFALMGFVFFCNITAGIALVGFQSPLVQDLWRRQDPTLSAAALAACGATLIGISSLFNGVGRLAWGSLSDRMGRVQAFRWMLVSQVVVFLVLTRISSPWLFGALVCYVLLCYGGGFGTMPSFVLDVFGPRLMPVVYGTILTAWSAGGIVGPQIVAHLRDRHGDGAGPYAFGVSAAVLAVGFLASLGLKGTAHPDAGADAS